MFENAGKKKENLRFQGLFTMYMAEKLTLQSQEDSRMAVIIGQLSPEAQQADTKVRGKNPFVRRNQNLNLVKAQSYWILI